MKLDEILNGKLEQQIREGLAKLAEIAPKGGEPVISVSASSGCAGYVAARVDGVTDLAAYGCSSIPEAVEEVIAKVNNPEAITRRRQAIESQLAKLQAELDAIPAPITVVPTPAALEA